MRPMIVLAPEQINSDRAAPGITTSAVGGVEVNLSCDYQTHFLGAGVAAAIAYVQEPSWAETCTRPGVHRGGEGRMAAFETRVKT